MPKFHFTTVDHPSSPIAPSSTLRGVSDGGVLIGNNQNVPRPHSGQSFIGTPGDFSPITVPTTNLSDPVGAVTASGISEDGQYIVGTDVHGVGYSVHTFVSIDGKVSEPSL